MKAARDYRDFLQDILSACRSIIGFAQGMTLEAYLADDDTILFTTIDAELKPLLPRLEALVREHDGAPPDSP